MYNRRKRPASGTVTVTVIAQERRRNCKECGVMTEKAHHGVCGCCVLWLKDREDLMISFRVCKAEGSQSALLVRKTFPENGSIMHYPLFIHNEALGHTTENIYQVLGKSMLSQDSAYKRQLGFNIIFRLYPQRNFLEI